MDGLFLRGQDGYEQARVGRVFNRRRPDRYPAAVLLAADAGAVADGVRLAAERGWAVSVRAGGHSWAAWSVRDDTLLIDLGNLNTIAYDESTGIATAGPAVRGGLELAPFLAERGRSFPGGHCPSVGIGGFLLQGGQGWNSRSVGWACESVVAVDVVTAAGEQIRADARQHSDLYWAARGAGPGFPAVVTRFHLRTFPAYPHLWHDTWSFAPDDGAALLAWLHDLLPKLDRRVEPVVAATRLPGVPLDPGVEHPGTVLLLHTTVMTASPEEASDLLRAFDNGPLAGRALGHVRGATSIAEENAAQAAQNPEGYRYAVDCTWTDAPADVARSPAVAVVARAGHRALVLDLVRVGAEPAAAGHGVLGRGERLRGDLCDLRERGGRRALPFVGARAHGGRGLARRRRGLPRRHRLHPAAGPVPLRRQLRAARARSASGGTRPGASRRT